MFVTCGKCNAEYELDDAKIPAGGARLRCTNCDHSFVIAPPEASDPQSADDLAHDALSTEAPGGADPEPEEEAAPEEDFEPDGESDWEFNEEIHFTEPQVKGAFGSSEPEADEKLEFFEPEANEEIGFSEPEANEEIGFAEPEANEEIGFSEPEVGGEEPEPAFDQSGDWNDLSTTEDGVDDLLDEKDGDSLRVGESTDDLTSGSEFLREGLGLGEPAAIDGSAGDTAADGSHSVDDLSDSGLGEQPAETDASALSAAPKDPPAAVARAGGRAEPQVEIAGAMARDSSTSVRWTDRILAIAGWGVALPMMIVALVGGLAPNWSDA
ncbi:MAG: zinc-ribbon domain-containing protein, partial [Myxococcales bacterium]|nr:zinc-ribbon domain-containing protein [Myxococcales bacterium]